VRLIGQSAAATLSTADGPRSPVQAEFALGAAEGVEQRASFGKDATSGVTITRSSSWWNHRRCKTCGHTFRRGDRALVDPIERTAQHLVPGLVCGTDPEPAAAQDAATTGQERAEFAAGLLTTWQPTVRLTLLKPGDFRIPRPGSTVQAPTCLYCGHTFRAGEYVVVCPCRTAVGAPAACDLAVHRDPAAGLACWETWQPGGELIVCPLTTAKLKTPS
jgi:hypothetical protein